MKKTENNHPHTVYDLAAKIGIYIILVSMSSVVVLPILFLIGVLRGGAFKIALLSLVLCLFSGLALLGTSIRKSFIPSAALLGSIVVMISIYFFSETDVPVFSEVARFLRIFWR